MKRILLISGVALLISGAQGLMATNTSDAVATNASRQILIEAVVIEMPARHAKELDLGFPGSKPLDPSRSKFRLSDSTNGVLAP